MFLAEIFKISEFLSENFHFLVVKFSVYLNRHVFVMGHYAELCIFVAENIPMQIDNFFIVFQFSFDQTGLMPKLICLR